MRSVVPVVFAPVVAVLSLAGCSGSAGDPGTSQGTAASGCPITATDTWAKAAESGMTSVFGRLGNTGSAQVRVVSATSSAAGAVEIHEVVTKDGAMVMQPRADGLVLAAGATATLAPGGDHLMLMDLKEPVKAGDTVTVTLQCEDGTTAMITAAARTFTGAAEQYDKAASPGGPDANSAQPSAS